MTMPSSEVEAVQAAALTGSVLHLLGGLRISVDGRRYEIPEGSKRLLVFVVLRPQCVERRQVAGTLWCSGSEERVAGNLRSALWRLRSADIDVLVADKTSLRLREDVTVDVECVRAWASRLITGATLPHDLIVSPTWQDALDLLPGWYDDWALMERERATATSAPRARGAESRAGPRRALCRGRRRRHVRGHRRTAARSAQRALLSAHLAEGNRMEGLRSLDAYRRLLLRELGAEPAADLVALAQSGSQRPPLRVEVAGAGSQALTG